METGKSFPANVDKTCQKTTERKPTLRFTLTLVESTDDKNPEFSFTQLARTAKSKGEEISNEKDPWEDDHEDEKLKLLAKKFEEKYGPKTNSKKKIRDRIEDLIDVGYGYDEADPFVDNSEAYDELISADWTTEHGGFYINQGMLHFKRVKEDDDSDHEFKVPKKKKGPKKIKDATMKVKKVKDVGEKKRKLDKDNKEKKPKRIRLSSEGKEKEKKHKKKHSIGSAKPTVSGNKSPTTTTNTVLSSSSSNAVASTSSSASTASVTTDTAPSTPNGQTDSTTSSSPDESLAKLTVKTEPLRTQSDDSSKNNTAVSDAASADGNASTMSSVNHNGPQDNNSSIPSVAGNSSTVIPKLPPGLSSGLESCVKQLKEAAEGCADGKCKFFNRDVNNLLLEVETGARELSCRVRSGIYEYLAVYLPCSKETIQKRAKKLLLTDQNGRLREPMAKLKAAVDRIMPEQEKRFQEEVQKHVEEQSQCNDGKSEGENKVLEDQKELFKSAMAIDDDAEATTPTDPNAPSSTQDKTKNTAPKRKFIWNGELRKLLCDVVQMKLKLYEMSKTRTHSAEEYIKQFFETEVRPLWPKGWMTTRILYKESKQAHHDVTNLPAKAKKAAQGTKKTASKTGETSESQESNGEDNKMEPKPVNPVSTETNSSLVVKQNTLESTLSPAATVVNLPPVTTTHPLTTPLPVIVSTPLSSVIQRPTVTTAAATRMESTSAIRTDVKPSVSSQLTTRPSVTVQPTSSVVPTTVTVSKNEVKSVPTTEGVKPAQQVRFVHIPKAALEARSACEPKPAHEPVTILDFADLISPDQRQQLKLPSDSHATKPLQHLPSVTKTSAPSPPKSYAPLVYQPKVPVLTSSSVISPPRTQTVSTAQQPVAQAVRTSQPSYNKEPGLTSEELLAVLARNNLVNLCATSIGSAGNVGTVGSVAGPSSVLDAMTSPQRRPADVGVLKTSPAHVNHPVPTMNLSLNTSAPSSILRPSLGVPSIPLYGHVDLQGKMPSSLSQLGRVPPQVHPAMMHLARQQQERGIMLPQNAFSQVLAGLSQHQSTDSIPTTASSVPLNHTPGVLLTSPSMFQDPNHANPNGATQPNSSQFLHRFNS